MPKISLHCKWLLLSFLLGSAQLATAVNEVVVVNMVALTKSSFELQIVTSQPAEVQSFSLKNPFRATFDLQGVQLGPQTRLNLISLPDIKGVRFATNRQLNRNAATLRVVVDMDYNPTIQQTIISSVTSSKYIWTISWQPPSAALKAVPNPKTAQKTAQETGQKTAPKAGQRTAPAQPKVTSSTPAVAPQVRQTEPRDREISDIVIIIDPGHGGKDPGAISQGRSKEKDIVLQVAKELQKLFEPIVGYKVILSRNIDTFVSLTDRQTLARMQKAHLMLSLHADSAPNNRAAIRGVSVYTLNEDGASSEFARLVAEKANSTEQLVLGNLSLVSVDAEEAEVLISMQQRQVSPKSKEIAESLLRELSQVSPLHKAETESANFAVLRMPDVPAVLVELGFISNAKDAKKLKSKKHRKAIAQALFRGVNKHFSKHPPNDTWLAAYQSVGGDKQANLPDFRYTVQDGDTLSSIARHYDVALETLRSSNGQTDKIYPGDVLIVKRRAASRK